VSNLLLTFLLLSNISTLCLIVYALFKFNGIKKSITSRIESITNQVQTFFNPVSDGTPSEFAKLTDNISVIFARSIAAQVKTTLMGIQSGMVRAQKAVEGDIAEGIVEGSSPIASAALNALPGLRKTLRRNPGLADIAAGVLSRIGTSRSDNPGNNGDKVKFHL
jgi:hypothetical protein